MIFTIFQICSKCYETGSHVTLNKKWSFPLKISSVNVSKSAAFYGFVRIYWRNAKWKTFFFVQYGTRFGALCGLNKESFVSEFNAFIIRRLRIVTAVICKFDNKYKNCIQVIFDIVCM